MEGEGRRLKGHHRAAILLKYLQESSDISKNRSTVCVNAESITRIVNAVP